MAVAVVANGCMPTVKYGRGDVKLVSADGGASDCVNDEWSLPAVSASDE